MHKMLDWLVDTCVERTHRPARSLAALATFVLAFIAGLQFLNPGSAERIGSDDVGRGLFGALALLLAVVAVIEAFDVVLRRPRAVLEPGIADTLLHLAMGWAALRLALLDRTLPANINALVLGALGFGLLAAGMRRWSRFALSSPFAREEGHSRGHRALSNRDDLARGAVFLVLGGLAVADAMLGANLGDHAPRPWGSALVAVGALALFGYGLHALWSIAARDRLWMQ